MQRDLIYDVGMFDGSDTAYYLGKGFRVVAVEANPSFCDQAKERFRTPIEQGKLIIVQQAIAASPGKISFGIHRTNKEWSSTAPSRLARLGAEMDIIEVECERLDTLIRQHGDPYYIKIDIEEADLEAVESLQTVSEFPPYISVEATSVEILDRLFSFGYRRFLLVDQGTNEGAKPKYFGREGKFVKTHFTGSHSGPFGRERREKWLSYEEVRAQYQSLVAAWKLSWHDFHAALPSEGLFRRFFKRS